MRPAASAIAEVKSLAVGQLMSTTHGTLKQFAEVTLLKVKAGKVFAAIRAERVAVLAYHNVVPTGERAAGDRSLHLPQKNFAEQLDALCESHTIISLEALGKSRSGGGKPLAVITFDDAYRGAMTAGQAELHVRGLPSTVFVSPGLLGSDGFWWDRLSDPDTGILPVELRDHALMKLGGRGSDILSWAAGRGRQILDLPDHSKPATLSILQSAALQSQVSFGSHSWNHLRLPSMSEEALRSDLKRTRAWLKQKLSATSDWLAYPYGHSSQEASTVAAEFSIGALLVSGGLVRHSRISSDRFACPRINVPSGISIHGFRLRLAGLR